MKRSKTSSRAMRALNNNLDSLGDSRYARKVKAGGRMYGSKDKRESCCGHRIKLAGEQ